MMFPTRVIPRKPTDPPARGTERGGAGDGKLETSASSSLRTSGRPPHQSPRRTLPTVQISYLTPSPKVVIWGRGPGRGPGGEGPPPPRRPCLSAQHMDLLPRQRQPRERHRRTG